MTTLSSAKTLLVADTTAVTGLVALATGGIYTIDDLGRLGLNRTNSVCAAAFGSNVIKPCLMLKIRSDTVVDGLGDDVTQRAAHREVLELWFYDDNGFTTIDAMRGRAFACLHGKQVGNATCHWQFDSQQFTDSNLDAMGRRMDFAVYGLK